MAFRIPRIKQTIEQRMRTIRDELALSEAEWRRFQAWMKERRQQYPNESIEESKRIVVAQLMRWKEEVRRRIRAQRQAEKQARLAAERERARLAREQAGRREPPIEEPPMIIEDKPFPILPIALGGAALLGVILLTRGRK